MGVTEVELELSEGGFLSLIAIRVPAERKRKVMSRIRGRVMPF